MPARAPGYGPPRRGTYLLNNVQNIRRLDGRPNKLDLLWMNTKTLVGQALASQLVDEHVGA